MSHTEAILDLLKEENKVEKMSLPSSPNYGLVKENGYANSNVEACCQAGSGFDSSVRLDLLKESPELVAEQLTKLCSSHFAQIQREEFLGCCWEKKDKFSKAPCICEFQDFFNRTCAWVTKTILNIDTSEKQRADYITQFIKIAKKLLEFKNFHSFMAIVISLERHAIIRLKRTWKKVDGKKTFDNLTEIISLTNNYEKLWSVMKKSDIPCIPYLGMFTKRFVELSAAVDLSLKEDKEAICVYEQLVNQLGYYQRSMGMYAFKENNNLKRELLLQLKNCYLNEFEKFFDTDINKLSLQIEPAEMEGTRTLKPTNSNPLTPLGSPRKCATIPRKRTPLVVGVSNITALENRSPTPPEQRAIGLSDATICNPLNVSTSTLPSDFCFSSQKKIGHRKIKSYGGSTNRTDLDPLTPFGAANNFIQCLSVPKEYVNSLSPEDAGSLRSNNTSSGSSDNWSFGDGFEDISGFVSDSRLAVNGTEKQPIEFISAVKLKLKDTSRLKLSRSHKYLLQLYDTEIVLTRRQTHTGTVPTIEKFEIPISLLPTNIPEKFEKDRRIYLHTTKYKEIKLKPRQEDYGKFLQILRSAIKLSKSPHNADLIDFNEQN